MKIHVFYDNIYSPEKKTFTSGGVQTYFINLLNILEKYSSNINLYQHYKSNGLDEYKGVNIHSIKGKYSMFRKNHRIKKYIKNRINSNDLVIFLDERLIFKTKSNKTIAVQHGIYWDDLNMNKKFSTIQQIKKFLILLRRYKDTRKYKNLNTLVCVDYNYLNWFRTINKNTELKNVRVITNSVKVNEFKKQQTENIEIIFARRFVEKRGVVIFSQVADVILIKYPQIKITFSGRGPLKEWLTNKYKDYSNVQFDEYDSEESVEYHKNYDISVIPTLYSEGTSFSLLEAMSAKCAVIATNVGGMTNIIINGYNGILINPEYEELLEKISEVIEDNKYRKELADKGFDTVNAGFNIIKWEIEWEEVINRIIENRG